MTKDEQLEKRVSELEKEVKSLKEIIQGLNNQTSVLEQRTMPLIVVGESPNLLPGQTINDI